MTTNATDYAALAELRKHVPALKEWLGAERLGYLRGVYESRRGPDPTAEGDFIPVHFRLGMQIRNKLRALIGVEESLLPEHFYDDHWQDAVKLCLGMIE